MRLQRFSWPVLSGLCVIAVLLVLLFTSLLPVVRRWDHGSADTATEYTWHLKLLTEHADDPFWREVIAEGASFAVENDCLLDIFTEDYYLRYSLAELIDIAVLQEVDAIFIEADRTIEVAAAITRAQAAGIRVITLLGDAPDSGREVSIQVNSYLLGRQYGEAILALKDVQTVTVLLAERMDSWQEEQIYGSISESLIQSGIEVSPRVVRGDGFASEREIHRILTAEDPRPDVLVCLNAEDSLRAAQIMVDFNTVGDIDVIGYYDATEILQAVGKGILQATISLDAASVGQAAVESFLSLQKHGRASEYRLIQTRLVDATNFQALLDDVQSWGSFDEVEEGKPYDEAR